MRGHPDRSMGCCRRWSWLMTVRICVVSGTSEKSLNGSWSSAVSSGSHSFLLDALKPHRGIVKLIQPVGDFGLFGYFSLKWCCLCMFCLQNVVDKIGHFFHPAFRKGQHIQIVNRSKCILYLIHGDFGTSLNVFCKSWPYTSLLLFRECLLGWSWWKYATDQGWLFRWYSQRHWLGFRGRGCCCTFGLRLRWWWWQGWSGCGDAGELSSWKLLATSKSGSMIFTALIPVIVKSGCAYHCLDVFSLWARTLLRMACSSGLQHFSIFVVINFLMLTKAMYDPRSTPHISLKRESLLPMVLTRYALPSFLTNSAFSSGLAQVGQIFPHVYFHKLVLVRQH